MGGGDRPAVPVFDPTPRNRQSSVVLTGDHHVIDADRLAACYLHADPYDAARSDTVFACPATRFRHRKGVGGDQ